jgi:cytochrome P450 monooxygenase
MCEKAITNIGYDRVAMLNDTDAELDRIRAHGNVVWSIPLKRWMVVSHNAAKQALRDPRLHVSDCFQSIEGIERKTGLDLSHMVKICEWIPFLHDGARHSETRAVLARILANLKNEYFTEYERVSRRLLDAFVVNGGGDIARDYADLVHADTIGNLAGLDSADFTWIARHASSQGSIDFGASVSEMVDASDRARMMLNRLDSVSKRPATRSFLDQIGTQLSLVGIADTHQNRIECLLAIFMLGRDTLGGTLTIGLAYLLDHNDGTLTAQDWGKGDAFVDEFIRLSSTVQISVRVAQEDLELEGQTIAKDDSLLVFLPAANHDPETYGCPHNFEPGQKPHLAFGAGRHLCTGMPLARRAIATSLLHLANLGEMSSLPGREIEESRNTRKLKTFPIRLKRKQDPNDRS